MDRLETHALAIILLDDEVHVWKHSEFPHPLVTFDYNENGQLYRIVAASPRVRLANKNE